MNVPCCCQSSVRSVFRDEEAFGRRKDGKAKIFKIIAVEERDWID